MVEEVLICQIRINRTRVNKLTVISFNSYFEYRLIQVRPKIQLTKTTPTTGPEPQPAAKPIEQRHLANQVDSRIS